MSGVDREFISVIVQTVFGLILSGFGLKIVLELMEFSKWRGTIEEQNRASLVDMSELKVDVHELKGVISGGFQRNEIDHADIRREASTTREVIARVESKVETLSQENDS